MTAPHYLHNIQRQHDAVVSRVRDGLAEDARQALLHLLEYMGDSERFVPGSRLFDTMIRDLIVDAYEDQPSTTTGV